MKKSGKSPIKSEASIKGFNIIDISLIVGTLLLAVCVFSGSIWYAGSNGAGGQDEVRLYDEPSIEGLRPTLTSKSPSLIPATSTKCSLDMIWSIPNIEVPQVAAQVCDSYIYVGVESWIERVYAHRESWPNYKEYELPGFTAFEFGYGGQAMVINDDRDLAIYIRHIGRHKNNELLKDSFENGGSFERFVQRMRV